MWVCVQVCVCVCVFVLFTAELILLSLLTVVISPPPCSLPLAPFLFINAPDICPHHLSLIVISVLSGALVANTSFLKLVTLLKQLIRQKSGCGPLWECGHRFLCPSQRFQAVAVP